MNDIFDFGRFGKLFVYECRNYLPRYMKGLVVFSSVLFAAWMLTIAMDFPLRDRRDIISVLYTLAIFLSPYFIYKDMNNRKRGYSYAMIPASTLEKLLSMTLVSIFVVPVAVYVSLTLTDAVLYALSSMGIGEFLQFYFYNPFESSFGFVFDEYDAPVGSIAMASVSSITVAMMFNSIFRKNKIIKTVLFNMALGFLSTFVMIIFVQCTDSEFWMELARSFERFFNAHTPDEVMALYNCLITLYYMAIIAVTLVITYFRIKKVNY